MIWAMQLISEACQVLRRGCLPEAGRHAEQSLHTRSLGHLHARPLRLDRLGLDRSTRHPIPCSCSGDRATRPKQHPNTQTKMQQKMGFPLLPQHWNATKSIFRDRKHKTTQKSRRSVEAVLHARTRPVPHSPPNTAELQIDFSAALAMRSVTGQHNKSDLFGCSAYTCRDLGRVCT